MKRKTRHTHELHFNVPLWLHRYLRLRAAERDTGLHELLAALVVRDILDPISSMHTEYFIGCGKQLLANPSVVGIHGRPVMHADLRGVDLKPARTRTPAGNFAQETWPRLQTVCNAIAQRAAVPSK